MNDVRAIAPFDFHLHTENSHDGRGTVEDYCRVAVEQGMKAVGFCEHVDLDPDDVVFGQHDYGKYRSEVEEARAKYGDRLMIRMGAEIGYVPRIEKEISDYLNQFQYDYVVGAVHTIDDGFSGISEEYDALETFARHEFVEVYEQYFDIVRQMMVSGLFDVVGHLDLVNRYGVHYLQEELEWGIYYGQLRRIFEGLIKRQMALEINTSGLRQPPQATYPPRVALDLYREVGGRSVIIGSDAHSPDLLGSGVPAALSLARSLRLNPYLSFKDRLLETVD
jgi:histidinol-phosphatase (PHP family)